SFFALFLLGGSLIASVLAIPDARRWPESESIPVRHSDFARRASFGAVDVFLVVIALRGHGFPAFVRALQSEKRFQFLGICGRHIAARSAAIVRLPILCVRLVVIDASGIA